MVSSERWSAAVTKLPGPFTDTCSCSISPKSRASPRPALRAAAIITFMKGRSGHLPLRLAYLSGDGKRTPPLSARSVVSADAGAHEVLQKRGRDHGGQM